MVQSRSYTIFFYTKIKVFLLLLMSDSPAVRMESLLSSFRAFWRFWVLFCSAKVFRQNSCFTAELAFDPHAILSTSSSTDADRWRSCSLCWEAGAQQEGRSILHRQKPFGLGGNCQIPPLIWFSVTSSGFLLITVFFFLQNNSGPSWKTMTKKIRNLTTFFLSFMMKSMC